MLDERPQLIKISSKAAVDGLMAGLLPPAGLCAEGVTLERVQPDTPPAAAAPVGEEAAVQSSNIGRGLNLNVDAIRSPARSWSGPDLPTPDDSIPWYASTKSYSFSTIK